MAHSKEDIRRQRRIQRQRQLKRQRIALITIAVIIMLLIVGYIGKRNKDTTTDNAISQTEEINSLDNTSVQTEEDLTEEDVVSEEDLTEEDLTEEEKKQYVLDHSEEYTDALIDFMNKYDQTIDFVYYYTDQDYATIYDEETETVFPLYIQWDARWGYEEYADSIIGIAGCGPTCLAMVYEGLTGNGNQTPITVANMSESNGYSLSGGGSTWNLMTEGSNDLGLNYQELPLYESKMIEELENGRPIICNVGPGDFTDGGHFIVIAGYEDGKFIVNDPNSIENSSVLWEYSVLESQIKNLWSFWV